jgi:hypothetical protein
MLSKLTEPSWDKILSDLDKVKSVLYNNICDICLRELDTEFDIDDLLNTRCGEEFRLDELDLTTAKCEKVYVDDEGVMQVEMTCCLKEPISQIHITAKLDNNDEWTPPPNRDRSEL